MAASRSRRHNAGNKIAKLLDEEEEDDFYKTSYGGFQDEEEDKEYEYVHDCNYIFGHIKVLKYFL